ncbi:hypothetical protein KIW84_071075 [Lathyrus oleraceus]|uniref:Transmembrane protein n=1 Tax=Pisum sativum TaxID=3888 RepID=A0A9D4VJS3_PEA|nr:hypothetical protein KIW84_071075 [Pisum sativum]
MNNSTCITIVKIQIPNTLLKKPNSPPKKILSLLLIRKCFLIQFLILKLTIYVITHGVIFLVKSMHVNNFLQFITQFLIQQLLYSEFFSPANCVFDHGESFFHLKISCTQKLQQNHVASFVGKKWYPVNGYFFWW